MSRPFRLTKGTKIPHNFRRVVNKICFLLTFYKNHAVTKKKYTKNPKEVFLYFCALYNFVFHPLEHSSHLFCFFLHEGFSARSFFSPHHSSLTKEKILTRRLQCPLYVFLQLCIFDNHADRWMGTCFCNRRMGDRDSLNLFSS